MLQEHCEDSPGLGMAHWLLQQLINKTCPGMEMISNTERTFRIPWYHGKSGGLKPGGDDTNFIIAWAKHRKYKGQQQNDKDLSLWKSKFRNALNKCSNIKRIETTKKEYKVCSFTEDFFAKFNSIGSQNRKRVSPECLLNNNNVSMEDCPPRKKSNYSNPDLGLKENLPTELNSIITKNPVPVTSSSPHCTNMSPHDTKIHCIQVEIVYGKREKRTVKCEILEHSETLYRIASFHVATLKELLSEEGELSIQLPRLEDLSHFKFSEGERKKISEILLDMERGILLKHDCRGIFLQRRSLVKVYLTDSDGKYPATPVSRSKHDFMKAFDMSLFENDLNSYVQRESTCRPKPGFILTVGHDIDENEDNPLESCYIYIEVTHMWANEKVKESNNVFRFPKTPLCSGPDGLDIMITLAQRGADPVPGISTEHLADGAFSEISSLQRELSCPQQTQSTGEKYVMAVEINSPFFESRRILVGESASRCRIFYGAAETQMSEDNFKKDNSLEVQLPDINTLELSSVSEEVRLEVDKFMKDLHRGVHLICNERSILAERRTVLLVFQYEANTPCRKLERRTMSEKPDPKQIFDFTRFEKELGQHKNGDPLPKPFIVLTIGQEIKLGANDIFEDVYLSIKVTHLLAERLLQDKMDASFKHSTAKYSLPDSIDETVKCLQDLALIH